MAHFALRIDDEAAWLAAVEREGATIRYGGVVHGPHNKSWHIGDPTGYEIEVVLWENSEICFDHAAQAVAPTQD